MLRRMSFVLVLLNNTATGFRLSNISSKSYTLSSIRKFYLTNEIDCHLFHKQSWIPCDDWKYHCVDWIFACVPCSLHMALNYDSKTSENSTGMAVGEVSYTVIGFQYDRRASEVSCIPNKTQKTRTRTNRTMNFDAQNKTKKTTPYTLKTTNSMLFSVYGEPIVFEFTISDVDCLYWLTLNFFRFDCGVDDTYIYIGYCEFVVV